MVSEVQPLVKERPAIMILVGDTGIPFHCTAYFGPAFGRNGIGMREIDWSDGSRNDPSQRSWTVSYTTADYSTNWIVRYYH